MSFFKKLFSEKGISVFEEYNTEIHDYKILIRNIRNREGSNHSIYFLDDKIRISKLHKKVKLVPASTLCRGGYDYSISLFKDDKLEKSMLVCFNCNRLVFRDETEEQNRYLFEITSKKFHSWIKEDFQLAHKISKEFESKKDALKYWESEQNNSKLIKQKQLLPDWMRFDGRYTLSFSIEETSKNKNPNHFLEEKISNFGNCGEYEFGQLMAMGDGEKNGYIFSITSSKRLFEKFEEFEPNMLAKNLGHTPEIFFLEDWTELNDFKLELYYKK